MDFFALTLKRFVWKTKVCYRNVDNQQSATPPRRPIDTTYIGNFDHASKALICIAESASCPQQLSKSGLKGICLDNAASYPSPSSTRATCIPYLDDRRTGRRQLQGSQSHGRLQCPRTSQYRRYSSDVL